MQIFIDESGNFSPVKHGEHSPSVVGALIIPEHKMPKLLRRYAKLRCHFPLDHKGEVKGKSLTEDQVASCCDLLKKSSALFEAVVVDMGLEGVDDLELHKNLQAEAITINLNNDHSDNIIQGARSWRRMLEGMSLPLYAQSVAMLEVVLASIRHSTLYYSQRFPKEIGHFDWVIDAKGVSNLTPSEKWWSETILPMIQARSSKDPMPQLDGADYSFFDRKYSAQIPEYVPRKFPNTSGININKLMQALRFSSDPEPGLELVDILTNATRRALKGNLGKSGWDMIPEIMIARDQQCIRVISFVNGGRAANLPYADIIKNGFGRGRKIMLAKGPFS